MDVVYIVRPGDHNEELRHSLRTLTNLPHDRVWLVGYTPSWVTGVESVHTAQGGTKYANSTGNVLTACSADLDISDPFILMNDDFFIREPITEIPTLHRGLATDVLNDYRRRLGPGHYIDGMAATLNLLRDLGHDSPLSYELHVPLVVHKDTMRKAIEEATAAGIQVPHKRTLYGNLAGIGGTQADDVKVVTSATIKIPGPFVSTCDKSFTSGWIGRRLRATYSEPGAYER